MIDDGSRHRSYCLLLLTHVDESNLRERAAKYGLEDEIDALLLSRLQTNNTLSDADAAVLACADTHDGVAVMDETYGRDVAAVEDITTRGTAYLVLKLTKQGAISVDEARTVIDAMIDEGWYCALDVYTKLIQKLEAFSE